jgi:hypothetical protein
MAGTGRLLHREARRKPMSPDTKSPSTDLVRWSFTIDPTHRAEIEIHLVDLGADVLVRDGQDLVVTWEEPESDLAEVIESIWSLNGESFEIVQEDFHRLALHTIQQADDGDTGQQAA